jgi:mannose-6-phosphate isomerase-like protein (cupin superfamily)
MIDFLSEHDLRSPFPPVEMTMSARAFERAAVAMAHAMREVCEEASMPVDHAFTDGIYTRTIHMPAGVIVVGHKHRTRHQNVILSGRAIVVMNGERVEVQAGDVITSDAGVRKVLFIEEDCKWMTIHGNAQNGRDIGTLEAYLVDQASANLRDERLIKEFRESFTPTALL